MSGFELESLRESIVAVLAKECGRREVHAFIDGKLRLDATLWGEAGRLGWLGIGLPEDFGGLGLGAAGLDALYTELGRQAAPGAFMPTLAAAQAIAEAAPANAAWLERAAAGDLKIAIPALVDFSAALPANGQVLSDRSLLMLGDPASELALVPVTRGGIKAWAFVELDGASLAPQPTWDRTRSFCMLRGGGLRAAMVMEDTDGRMQRTLLRHLCLAIAADSIGGADAILGQTVEYLKTRQQFGKPIGTFQALKHRVADMVILLATNRHLVAQAAESGELMWAALAKASASEAYRRIAADCVQLHGGIGFTWEYDCHIFLKRARLNEALAAANGALRDLAAEELAALTADGGTAAEIAA